MSIFSIDARLVGMWYVFECKSGGEISFNSKVYRIFGPDRRFVELTEDYDSPVYETDGDWKGWDMCCADFSLKNRGRWNTDDSTLYLYWDDNRYRDYKYEYDRNALILMPNTSQAQFWTRQQDQITDGRWQTAARTGSGRLTTGNRFIS